jgi:hypothetical protein
VFQEALLMGADLPNEFRKSEFALAQALEEVLVLAPE